MSSYVIAGPQAAKNRIYEVVELNDDEAARKYGTKLAMRADQSVTIGRVEGASLKTVATVEIYQK